MKGAFETHSFMASITIHCPRCNSDHVYRHGKTPAGHVRYRCPICPQVFQLTYTYGARKPSVKDKIVDLAFNGSGIRDTARVLKIGINTAIRALKKLTPRQVTSEKVVLDDVAQVLPRKLYRSSYYLKPASNRCLGYVTLVRTPFGINFRPFLNMLQGG